MRNLVLWSLFTFTLSYTIEGQYISGKMIPESTSGIKDLKDDAYLLSTTITAKEMKDHLSILASDEYQGRETGEKGNDLAAEYIAREFNKLGLPKIGDRNGYFQSVAFTFSSWKENAITINGSIYKQLWDYLGFPQSSQSLSLDTEEVVFVGYGINESGVYTDYQDIDVSGKIVLAYDGEPMDQDGISIISGSKESSKWAKDYELKRLTAQKMGAKVLLIVSNDIKEVLNANRRILVNRVTTLGDYSEMQDDHTNLLIISSTMAQDILGEQKDEVIKRRNALRDHNTPMQSLAVQSQVTIKQTVVKDVLKGQNVLGYIEGNDLKDELVIVSAHYDHVGTKGDEVYNGADDDGSGTTTVIEIAETLAIAKKMGKGPRRSVLCLLVTGEEKGLLGSEYYSENPLFPISNTVVDVNIDMVGRWGEEYLAKERPYIYVIGSDRLSTDLHKINEAMNLKYCGMVLDYKYNDENDPNRFYFRSDHYNFAKKGIPSIFFFNGVHEDYHRTTDTVDKIDFNLMEQRGRLIFHTLWNIANRNERIQVDVE
jgi:hypothetical protein